jgi:dTDP-glucose 4,6-dehydratase
MRLLVTGGAGFIGSNFVRHWVSERPDDRVVVLDLLTYAGNEANLSDVRDRIGFVQGDIGEQGHVEKIIASEEIDTIVNFAAETHNSYAIIDPSRFFRTNLMGTQALLEAARRMDVARFHHVSTDEVFGDLPVDGPVDGEAAFTEESPYRPRGPYSAAKAGADHAVRAYHETFGLATTITNCSNNYGPFQFPEKVVPLFTTNALIDKPLPLYSSTRNTRQWLHVLDHCRAIERVLLDGRIGETYNVAADAERSIEEIADAILDTLDKPKSLKAIVPDRPGHDRRYTLDWTKIHDELGWEPQIDFDEGLRDTVMWYAEHREWWEPLRERAPVDEDAWASPS